MPDKPDLAARLRTLKDWLHRPPRRLEDAWLSGDQTNQALDDLEAAAKLAEGFDVTPRIAESLEMFIRTDVFRAGEVDPTLLVDMDALLSAHNWSPEMHTAISLLVDIKKGHVWCIRDRQTQDH